MSTWQLWRHLWTPDLRGRSLWLHPRMLLWQPFARKSTFAARWSWTSLGLWRTWASLCVPAVRWATALRQPQFHCLKVFSMSRAIHCWGVHASFPSSSCIFARGTPKSNFTCSMHLWCYLWVLFGGLHPYFCWLCKQRWSLESGFWANFLARRPRPGQGHSSLCRVCNYTIHDISNHSLSQIGYRKKHLPHSLSLETSQPSQAFVTHTLQQSKLSEYSSPRCRMQLQHSFCST